MENPFKFGGVVHEPYFAGRTEETETLLREIENLSRVFLISPRRYGKTCLLWHVIEKLNAPFAYIDLNAHPSIENLAVTWAASCGKALETNIDQLRKFFDSFQAFRPKLAADFGDVSYSIQLDHDFAATGKGGIELLLEALAKAETLARKKRKKLAVFVDEFSDLAKYDGDTLEKAMRSEIQRHQNIAYIFAGSEQSIMLDMATNKNRPFYKMGRLMKLGPIEQEQYWLFIKGWFSRGKRCFSKIDTCKHEIFKIGHDVPHNIQRICHNLWNETDKSSRITPEMVQKIPAMVAKQDSPHYEIIWRVLTTQQRKVLMALSKGSNLKPLSKEFGIKYQINPPSSIKAAIGSLRKKGILYYDADATYRFTDMFFQYYLNDLSR